MRAIHIGVHIGVYRPFLPQCRRDLGVKHKSLYVRADQTVQAVQRRDRQQGQRTVMVNGRCLAGIIHGANALVEM